MLGFEKLPDQRHIFGIPVFENSSGDPGSHFLINVQTETTEAGIIPYVIDSENRQLLSLHTSPQFFTKLRESRLAVVFDPSASQSSDTAPHTAIGQQLLEAVQKSTDKIRLN